jgi:uncharacterized protein YjbI with pentapeptide repeats
MEHREQARRPRTSIAALAFLLSSSLTLAPANASDLTLRQVVETLFKARPASQPDFAGKDLSSLDLSGLDFKQARLTGANLLGADLTDANLSKADLSGAKLDRTRLARTNFSGANLTGASFFHAVGTVDFEAHSTNAPNFTGANLSGARIMARLSRAVLRGANLADARLGPPEPGNELKTPQQTDLAGAILANADLRRADLSRVNLAFADLSGADLTDANLAGADLSRAVLRGANLSGANLEEADLNGADFAGAQGISGAHGLGKARNRDKAAF